MLPQTISNKIKTFFASVPGRITGYLLLSWLYAIASQIIIPLPFNLVPLSIQPMPLLLASFAFGWHAVTAYVLYLIQGGIGLPFFAGMQGGIARLLGPTGGYLVGFGLAMVIIAATKAIKPNSRLVTLLKLIACYALIFTCGLVQLSWFVPSEKLLAVGLLPFILGDFLIKPAIIMSILFGWKRSK